MAFQSSSASQQDVDVAWAPLPGSQELFLTCPIREVLYEGTRGPGKTEALLMSFAMHVGCGYGDYWRGIIFRQTYKQLSDLIVKSQRLFYSIFPGARYNKSEHVWIFPTGEQLFFRQIRTVDDYWDYHGHEYPFIAFEELTSWQNLEPYHMMKSCLRCSKQGVPRMLRSTTNPFGVGHSSVKSYFINPAPRGQIIYDEEQNERVAIHGNVHENLYLLKADPQYIARLKAIKDPNVRAAWLDGSWNINAGGAVDDLYNEAIHILPKFDVPRHWRITRSFDWGSSAPFSVGWHATSNGEEVRMADGTSRSFPRGTKLRIHEFYGSNGQPNEGLRWTNIKIAERIKSIEQDLGIHDIVQAGAADSAIYGEGNGFGKSIASEMEECGIAFMPAPKGPGSRRTRLSLLRSALEAGLTYPMERPGLFAFDTCRDFVKQIPELARDPNDYECVDTGGEDHLYDELTYELSVDTDQTSALSIIM